MSDVVPEQAIDEDRARLGVDGRQRGETRCALDVMDALRPRLFSSVMVLRAFGNLVIRLAAPRQHVGEVGQVTEAGEQLDGAAALRADHSRELSGVHPQLVESVVVEIDLLA